MVSCFWGRSKKPPNLLEFHLYIFNLFLDIVTKNKSMLRDAAEIEKGDLVYVEGRILPKQFERDTRRFVKMTLITSCLVKIKPVEKY